MSDENARLLALARSISDGKPIDWERSEQQSADSGESELVRRLRWIEGIVEAHRGRQEGETAFEPTGGERSATKRWSWGPLEVLHKIGEGAFGEVYRARDRRLDREVALKLLRQRASEREEIATAVIEEGRLLARVRHPNVAIVHGAERHDGRVGLWMELIDGRTLADLLRSQGVFGAHEAGLVGLDLCRALAAVHRAGLVHRDVKAQNVMREAGGRIVLMDFSAGRDLSRVGDEESQPISGTPLYIAPEVFRDEPATAQADIYALGVLLFHLVTGAYPVEGSNLRELREAHARKVARPLGELRSDLPPAFVRVVERALAPNPEDRFRAAAGMEQALAAALGLEERGEGHRGEAASRSGRGKVWRLGVLIALVLVVVLSGLIARRALGERGAPRSNESSPASADVRPSVGNPAAPIPPPDAAGHAASTAAPGEYTVEGSFFRGTHVRERLAPADRIAVGDALSLDVKSSRPLYLYVINEDDQGEATLLFPLAGSDLANPLSPGTVHQLPGVIAGETQYWKVTSAGGREHFLIVASPERLTEFENETIALLRPASDQPVQYARLSEGAKLHLRGVAGLVAGPAHDRERGLALFEQARPLGAGAQSAHGVWARRIDLENTDK